LCGSKSRPEHDKKYENRFHMFRALTPELSRAAKRLRLE
jgi:hypothetical protein